MSAEVLPVQVLVLAKEPVAGRVKTRLCPPLTPAQSAQVAAAALADTLDAVRRTPVAARVLVVDGDVSAPGFTSVPQVGGDLAARLGAAFDDAASRDLPALLVGMDTPQLTPEVLERACRALLQHPAVLGRAEDGGWWALGLQQPAGDLLRGVPTSRDDTGALQAAQLDAAGLRVHDLPVLRDVDTVQDALAVAALAPWSRFAATLAPMLNTADAG